MKSTRNGIVEADSWWQLFSGRKRWQCAGWDKRRYSRYAIRVRSCIVCRAGSHLVIFLANTAFGAVVDTELAVHYFVVIEISHCRCRRVCDCEVRRVATVEGRLHVPASGYSAKPNPLGLPVSLSYTSLKFRTWPQVLKMSVICSSERPGETVSEVYTIKLFASSYHREYFPQRPPEKAASSTLWMEVVSIESCGM